MGRSRGVFFKPTTIDTTKTEPPKVADNKQSSVDKSFPGGKSGAVARNSAVKDEFGEEKAAEAPKLEANNPLGNTEKGDEPIPKEMTVQELARQVEEQTNKKIDEYGGRNNLSDDQKYEIAMANQKVYQQANEDHAAELKAHGGLTKEGAEIASEAVSLEGPKHFGAAEQAEELASDTRLPYTLAQFADMVSDDAGAEDKDEDPKDEVKPKVQKRRF